MQAGPPGYAPWGQASPPRTNTLAVVAFVLALMVPILPFVTVPMAHVARKQIREQGESGDAFAVIALVLAYLPFGVGLLVVAYGGMFAVAFLLDLVGVAAGSLPSIVVCITILVTFFLLEIWLWGRWVKRLRPRPGM